MSDLWLIMFWAEAHDDNLNTGAAAWRLGPPTDTYIWRSYPGLRLRVLLQGWVADHGPSWFRKLIHEPRPTGRWKKEPATLTPLGVSAVRARSSLAKHLTARSSLAKHLTPEMKSTTEPHELR
jgi:hypothetical protein